MLAAVLTSGCAVANLRHSAALAKQVQPLQAAPADPSQRLLIVGDSIGVGVGASAQATSIAGLIAAAHPDWLIDNRAANSARLADIERQLARGGRYDTVLVLGGGSDVIRLTGDDKLASETLRVARMAAALAPRVVLVPPGNVGHAPFFLWPWSRLMSARTRALYAAMRAAAAATGAVCVDLYDDAAADDPFVRDPQRMFSADGLHPGDAGYAAWYARIVAQARLER